MSTFSKLHLTLLTKLVISASVNDFIRSPYCHLLCTASDMFFFFFHDDIRKICVSSTRLYRVKNRDCLYFPCLMGHAKKKKKKKGQNNDKKPNLNQKKRKQKRKPYFC